VCARAEGITAWKDQQTDMSEQKINSSPDPVHQITWRKFELTDLCGIFFGFSGKIIAQISLALYCYGLLWAYSAVFASSVDSIFYQFVYKKTCNIEAPGTPEWDMSCRTGYYICLLIYACIVVPFSCLNVGEQASVQVLLTAYRFIAFTIMFVTVIVALVYPLNFNSTDPTKKFADPSFLEWSGFAGIFTTASVALNFHFVIPDLVRPVTNKKHILHMTTSALFVATVFYALMGILVSLYFGHNTRSLATLNWQTYTAIEGGWGGDVYQRPWHAVVIQLLVMLFPIFDMLSVFPLVAVSLGENIVSIIPDHNFFCGCCPTWFLALPDTTQRKITSITFRLLASIPPILLAAAAGSLNEIFKFTGLFSFFLCFVFPTLLHWKSKRDCIKGSEPLKIEGWGSKAWKTPYSGHFSSDIYIWITLLFGLIALVFSIFDFIVELAIPHFWG
jgi:hypothetical protein